MTSPADLSAPLARRLLADLEGAFRSAVETQPIVERVIGLANQRVRLLFAGPSLERRFFPALSHLAAASSQPYSLTVRIWDSASTGVSRPALLDPSVFADTRAHWRVKDESGIRFLYSPDGVAFAVDADAGRAAVWVEDAAKLSSVFDAAPLLPVIHAWIKRRGWRVLHAAAVGRPEGGVLFVGQSGFGKSSSALACLEAGLRFAGDDYCLVRTEGTPIVQSLYATAKLTPEGARRLPFFADLRGDEAGDKSLYFLHRAAPASLCGGFPLRALLIPRWGAPQTFLAPLSLGAAFRALAPSTLFQLGDSAPEDASALARLVRSVPCYTLHLDANPRSVAPAVEGFLDSCLLPRASA